MKEKEKKIRRRAYDESWKHVLDKYIWEFLEFYFPSRVEYIDKSKGYEFLDKELDKILPQSKSRKRRVDKLVKVFQRGEEPLFLMVHIEIQTYREREFAERMFTSHYRIYDRFKVPVASLAILGDPSLKFRPSSYVLEALGKKFLSFEFEICKLLDWKGREEELGGVKKLIFSLAKSFCFLARSDERCVASELRERGATPPGNKRARQREN